MEFDVQSHLAFLPKPFNGFVINANFTTLQSQTKAPYYKSWYTPDPRSPMYLPPILHRLDSTYNSVIPTQVNLMCNLAIGYDIKGFSIRTSLQYQGPSLRYVDVSGQDMNKKYTDQYLRVDVSAKQKFKSPWKYVKDISVFLNLDNLTNESNRQYQYKPEFWTSRIYYGRTAELGLQVSF